MIGSASSSFLDILHDVDERLDDIVRHTHHLLELPVVNADRRSCRKSSRNFADVIRVDVPLSIIIPHDTCWVLQFSPEEFDRRGGFARKL